MILIIINLKQLFEKYNCVWIIDVKNSYLKLRLSS